MTAEPLTAMKQLQEGLAGDLLGIDADLTTFPSGSAMLDVRRRGRAFVMAYTPQRGFGVDELGPDEEFLCGYRFVSEDFESAARHLKALATADEIAVLPPPSLSLVVLHSGNVLAARDFYTVLGLSFVEEQHGKGPRHYSATLGDLVLEIYPCQASTPPTPVRIGFRVSSLDRTLEMLRSRGARIVGDAKDSPWGRRAVAEDPDGNRVELTS